MRKLTVLFAATALLLTVSFAGTQPPPGKGAKKGGPKGGASDGPDLITYMMSFNKKKDGHLTRDELIDTRLHRLFDRADANKDGAVTRDELTAVAAVLAAENQGGPGDKGPGKGGKGPGDKGPGGPGGGFGPPGGPGRPGIILPPGVQEQLNLTDVQRRELAELQRDVDARLEKLLTSEQRKQLQELRGPGGFFGQKGKKGPPM